MSHSAHPLTEDGQRASMASGLRALSLVALGSALLVGGACRPRQPPNLLLVSVDTLRADRLNAYGFSTRVTSPNLDALAREGILFENAITPSPWTTPAHMSLLTSLTPSAHGMIAPALDLWQQLHGRASIQRLPEERQTLAEVLADHGYATAAFTGGVTLDPRIGFDQGFARYTTSMFKVHEAGVAEMRDWLRGHRDRPFFLFWHTFEVHFPYLDASFLGEVLPEPKASALARALTLLGEELRSTSFSDAFAAKVAMTLDRHGALTRPVCQALYEGGVRSVDRWLGRVLDALRAEGLYERTLIVVTSDHGEELGDHDPARFYNSHGHSMYEEMVRVPLILRLPGGAYAGTRHPGVVSTMDVFPTVLEVLSLPAQAGVEGVSLRAAWERREPSSRIAFVEATAFGPERKAVREARFKYVLSIDERSVAANGRNHVPEEPLARELYDLLRDPAETTNLLAGPPASRPERLATQLDVALRGRVARELGRTDRAELDKDTVRKLKALGYVQ